MKVLRNRKGLTIVEVMVTIVIASIAMSIAGSFINFSWVNQKRTVDEYEIQADLRLAADTLNYTIRDASVTFAITEEVFQDSKKDKWHYIGLENNKEIVRYEWDPVTETHNRVVLLPEREKLIYNLYFAQRIPNTKMLSFHLEGYLEGSEAEKAIIESELEALNSVAVEDGGTVSNPAVALAYRTDPKPHPEITSTEENITLAVALVLDDSGSMDDNMMGGSVDSGSSDPNLNTSRIDILKEKAQDLIDQFAALGGNVQVSIIPFSYSANNPGAMLRVVDEDSGTDNIEELQEEISSLDGNGATNAGDALRRAYYRLDGYQDTHIDEEVVYYIIFLTDGNPTAYSYNFYYEGWFNKVKTGYVMADGNVDTGWGSTTDTQYDAGSTSGSYNSLDYVDEVGSQLIAGGDVDIKTYVIGFSGVQSEVDKAVTIAEDYCTHASDPDRYGRYYAATSAVELEQVFRVITSHPAGDMAHLRAISMMRR